jgi:hypothetical protein
MRHPYVSLTLVGLIVGLSLVPRTLARVDSSGSYSVYPRVDATIIALEPQGLATIRTTNGTTYEVVQRPRWRVGDRVECEHVAYTRVPWERLNCLKVSS